MESPKITFLVTEQELEEILVLKTESGLTWRELVFKGLGLHTTRRVGGIRRKKGSEDPEEELRENSRSEEIRAKH